MKIAVTDKDGPVAFDRRGGAFSGRVVGGRGEDGPGGTVVDILGRSIDALVRAGEIPAPDFVKIDVEGGEGPVIAGMTDTLADRRPEIVLEMHHFAASSVAQAYAILDSNGYRFFRLDAYAGGLLPALAPNERKSARHILALPPTPSRSA